MAPGRSGKAGRALLGRAEVTRAPGTTWTPRGPERGCALSAKAARGARRARLRGAQVPGRGQNRAADGAQLRAHWSKLETLRARYFKSRRGGVGDAGSLFARRVPPGTRAAPPPQCAPPQAAGRAPARTPRLPGAPASPLRPFGLPSAQLTRSPPAPTGLPFALLCSLELSLRPFVVSAPIPVVLPLL